MELSFTDALISTDMIGAMIGATAENGAISNTAMYLKNVDVTVSNSDKNCLLIDTTSTPFTAATVAPMTKHKNSETTTADGYVCFVRNSTAGSEWELACLVTSGSGTSITNKIYKLDNSSWGTGDYCCKAFCAGSTSDTKFNLNADFVPSVLHAISYIDVYEAGTAACSGGTGTSTGRAVGQMIIDIPLFQLNNGLNLQLSTTPGTYDISGKALAKEDSGCSASSRTFGSIYYCATAS